MNLETSALETSEASSTGWTTEVWLAALALALALLFTFSLTGFLGAAVDFPMMTAEWILYLNQYQLCKDTYITHQDHKKQEAKHCWIHWC